MTEFQGLMIRGDWKDIELRKNKLWVIVSPLVWIRPNGKSIGLTPYLITDYATIPKIFWPILPKRNEDYDIAAAFHDDCMRQRALRNMTKKECHLIFKEIMKFNGTPKWQYEAMYTAVTIAGWFSRNDGYGELPWKLSLEEQYQYEKIKRDNLWSNATFNSNVHDDVDHYEIYT